MRQALLRGAPCRTLRLSRRSSTSTAASLQHGTRVLFLAPVWPEVHSSAAGVRTAALVRACSAWRCSVHYACSAVGSDAGRAARAALEAAGVATSLLPANRETELVALLAAFPPDVVVFDRFTTEEAFSFRVRELCPSALRVLDTQDLHALRRRRGVLVEAGASLDAVLAASPAADDADLLRELAAIHRSDLALLTSAEEWRRLTRQLGVPAHKLALASFFVPPAQRTVPAMAARAHCAFIGTFRHPPNRDAVTLLTQPGGLWDTLRPQLPVGTELHLFGAYPPSGPAGKALSSPERGVVLRGVAPSVAVLAAYRLLLAPLRSGAGVKGKVVDAWEQGTPVVTSRVGSEGLLATDLPELCDHAFDAGLPAGDWARLPGAPPPATWGGAWDCDTPAAFVAAAAALYSDEPRWLAAQTAGLAMLRALFDEERNTEALGRALGRALAQREEARASDWVGAMLWQQGARSTEFFSRWLEAKEALLGRDAA